MVQVTSNRILRRTVLAAATAAVVALAGVGIGQASTPGHPTTLRVNRTVALPGVVLPPGVYVFEIATPHSSQDVVRVWNRTSRESVFMGFTRRVARPRSLPSDQPLTFREAAEDAPLPIHAWYPLDLSEGFEFIYR